MKKDAKPPIQSRNAAGLRHDDGKAAKKIRPVDKGNKAGKSALNIPWLKLFVAALGLAIITYLTFSSAIHNRIVMWDNETYLYNNPLVVSPSVKLADIFTKPCAGNYAPLTIWSLRQDYKSNGLVLVPAEAPEQSSSNTQMKLGNMPLYDGTEYNLTDIHIHIFNVILVFLFWFFLRRGKELMEAFIVALLFAIHPMHVETVVWIADRKDQLCALFYFASLTCYVTGKQKINKWWDWSTLLFFVMALLCKATAVTLPVVLILIDLFFFKQESEKINWKKLIGNKWRYFAFAFVIGIITIVTQKNAKAIDAAHYSLPERFFFGFYALVNYLFKWIAPLPSYLSSFYPYPEKINGAYPWYIYASPIIVVALGALLVWRFVLNRRKSGTGNKDGSPTPYSLLPANLAMFSALFFLINIVLLLQFVSVGDALMADRYSYISYVGLFGIAAIFISNCWKKYSIKGTLPRAVMFMLFGGYFVFLGYISYDRSTVWFDNKTLWGDVQEKYPHFYLPSSQIGVSYEYENGGNTDSAMFYLSRSIGIKPIASTYMNRANIYAARSDFHSALSDLTNAVRLDSGNVMARGHRGIVYAMTDKMDSASADFNATIKMNPPGLSDACLQFAKAYNLHHMPDSAIVMLNKSLEADPKNTDAYDLLSTIKSAPASQTQTNSSTPGLNYSGKIKGTGKIIYR